MERLKTWIMTIFKQTSNPISKPQSPLLEHKMLDTIFTAVKDEFGLLHASNIFLKIEELISMVHDDYLKDGNARDAVLDALAQLIQQHKTGKV